MLNFERSGASSASSPQGLAAEMQEEGSRDGPKQRGVPSATGSREGAETSSVFDARPTAKLMDESIPNVGCMDCVSLDGPPTAMLQPQHPMCTASSAFLEVVVSDPIVDSEGGRIVNKQIYSDGWAGLGAQAADEMLWLTGLSRGRTGTGETEDDSIGVEDWLDVTHAMLDTSDPGLNLE